MFKRSIEVNSDGVYWMDSDSKFVYINDAGCKALGYKREELIGRNVHMINPKATAVAMMRVWEQLRIDGSFASESVHRRKDGSEFPVEIVSTHA